MRLYIFRAEAFQRFQRKYQLLKSLPNLGNICIHLISLAKHFWSSKLVARDEFCSLRAQLCIYARDEKKGTFGIQ
jgi:hypothetical protein